MPVPLVIHVDASLTQLENLRTDWEELLKKCSNNEPVLSPTWLIPWCKIYGNSPTWQPLIISFRANDRLVGLILLQRQWQNYYRYLPFLRLSFLGSGIDWNDGVYPEYLNFLCLPEYEETIVEQFVLLLKESRLGRWHEIILNMMPAEHRLTQSLQSRLTNAGLVVEKTSHAAAPFVTLPKTWDDYVTSLGKHRRYLLKTLRDFDEWADGNALFHLAENTAELDKGFAILQALHGERWSSEGQMGVFHAKRFCLFHKTVMPELLNRKSLELRWLTVRDQPLAVIYNIVWDNKIHFYQGGRSMSVPKQIRPGIVLHAHAIRSAIAASHREYDFLSGDTQYKRQLSNGRHDLVQLRIAKKTVREFLRKKIASVRTRD